MASQLKAFKNDVDSRNEKNPNTEENIVAVLQGYMEGVERIVFNGDGYSQEWEDEAQARGLSNNKTTPVALKSMISEKSKSVFGELNILNERELHSRYEVQLENYINKIAMEAELFQEMSRTYVLPAAYETINNLGETYRNLNDLDLKEDARSIVDQITTISSLTTDLNKDLSHLMETKTAADSLTDTAESAEAYADQVKPLFDKVRASIDKLEGLVDDKIWRLPKYRELLFIR